MLIFQIAIGSAVGVIIGGLILQSLRRCRKCGHAWLRHGHSTDHPFEPL